MITSAQIRAARALLGIDQRMLQKSSTLPFFGHLALRSFRIERSAIRSAAFLTYNQVKAALDEGQPKLAPMVACALRPAAFAAAMIAEAASTEPSLVWPWLAIANRSVATATAPSWSMRPVASARSAPRRFITSPM